MRNTQKWNEVQSSKQTEKEKSPRTHSHRHIRSNRKKREQKTTKNKIQINVLLQQLPILFPCTLLSALCQCHCLSTVSHSLFILLPLFIHLFSPLPSLSFITLMKKEKKKKRGECSEDIPRGQASAGRGDAERWRGTESVERKRENMIWCSPAMPTDKILVLCKKRLESYSKQRGHGEANALKFIICSLSKLNASTYTCGIQAFTENTLAYSHTSSVERLSKTYGFLRWLTL